MDHDDLEYHLARQQHLLSLLEKVHSWDHDDTKIDVEILNELAAGTVDPKIWNAILEVCGNIHHPVLKNRLGIAIFELLAEPPVHPIWLSTLERLLADPQRQWIVEEAYVNSPDELSRHLNEIISERIVPPPRGGAFGC
ncbi:hypothetical protein KBB96_08350 [Luteolibacter ambystomatis]|uniref:Uncharacterized protein n=1 Tax=Luteolibacter ambystomatis TaxID=2824561 RepID=A0A975J2M8_9BACT|nr:hypothetical protein [Luteolibacter ambystomatis]QUE52889.1 hypothetical protein KBB96_08350 [Luteolibacter ambystomatis]